MFLELIVLAVCAAGASLSLLALVQFVRMKRWFYAILSGIGERQNALERTATSIHKSVILGSVGDQLRLPPKMPSQHGEDVFLFNFFAGRRQGFFVEVGAYDGVGFSNTYFLEALGWDGILVEPSPEMAERCRKARPHSRVVQAACVGRPSGVVRLNEDLGKGRFGTLSYIGDNQYQAERIAAEGGNTTEIEVPTTSVDELMKGETRRIDLLSIDVEGAELEVLAGTNLRVLAPTVVVIEDNTMGKNTTLQNFIINANYCEYPPIGPNRIFILEHE